MKKAHSIISAFILILILLFVAWGTFVIGKKLLLVVFRNLDPQTLAALIATSGTIIVGIVAVIIGQQITKKREIQESHRPHKIKIYEEFMKKLSEMLASQKQGKSKLGQRRNDELHQKSIDEMGKYFVRFTREIIIWGSPKVIRAYTNFRAMGTLKERSPQILLKADDMFRKFRKDLGNSNRGLSKGELIKLFLTNPKDIDDLLAGKNIKSGSQGQTSNDKPISSQLIDPGKK